MTAQFAEMLLYDGAEHAMCTQPLCNYFAMGGNRPKFLVDCTALWRGYTGVWSVINDRLYLIKLDGTLHDGSTATVASVFPGFPDRVFAHWYCGTVRLPQGRRLRYVHQGYGSTYERDLLLTFYRGVLTQTKVRNNDISPAEELALFLQANKAQA